MLDEYVIDEDDDIESFGAIDIDAFKIPHHGSKYNLSKELYELLECKYFLVSTNGNYFKHPDDVAMARLIKFGTANSTIHFNYKTDHNRHWQNAAFDSSQSC